MTRRGKKLAGPPLHWSRSGGFCCQPLSCRSWINWARAALQLIGTYHALPGDPGWRDEIGWPGRNSACSSAPQRPGDDACCGAARWCDIRRVWPLPLSALANLGRVSAPRLLHHAQPQHCQRRTGRSDHPALHWVRTEPRVWRYRRREPVRTPRHGARAPATNRLRPRSSKRGLRQAGHRAQLDNHRSVGGPRSRALAGAVGTLGGGTPLPRGHEQRRTAASIVRPWKRATAAVDTAASHRDVVANAHLPSSRNGNEPAVHLTRWLVMWRVCPLYEGRLPSRRLMKRAVSTTKRWCVPLPTSSTPSVAVQSKSTRRPSTARTVVVTVTVRPGGVAAV